MNRRSFLRLLGLAPLLPLAAKLGGKPKSMSIESTGLTLEKLKRVSALLDSNEVALEQKWTIDPGWHITFDSNWTEIMADQVTASDPIA